MNKDLKIIKGILNILENYNEEYSDTDVEIINGLSRIFNDAEFESKINRDELGRFAQKSSKGNTKKEIPPYIPHFGRKPNPNFKYDDNKITDLIKDIEPENVSSSEIPIFKDTDKLEIWVKKVFSENKTITIKSDGEEILLSGNSAKRAARKQDPKDIKINSVFEKIKSTLEKSKYYDFESKNEMHKDKRILGQYVYFSKINIDGIPHRVRFKIDVPQDADGTLVYAGHRVQKI